MRCLGSHCQIQDSRALLTVVNNYYPWSLLAGAPLHASLCCVKYSSVFAQKSNGQVVVSFVHVVLIMLCLLGDVVF